MLRTFFRLRPSAPDLLINNSDIYAPFLLLSALNALIILSRSENGTFPLIIAYVFIVFFVLAFVNSFVLVVLAFVDFFVLAFAPIFVLLLMSLSDSLSDSLSESPSPSV